MRQKLPLAVCFVLFLLFGCGPLADEQFLLADREDLGEDFSWPVLVELELLRDDERLIFRDAGIIEARIKITNISDESIEGSFRVSSEGYAFEDSFSAGPTEEAQRTVLLSARAVERASEVKVSVDCGRKFGVFRRVHSSFVFEPEEPVAVKVYPLSMDRVIVSASGRLKHNDIEVRAGVYPAGDARPPPAQTAVVGPGETVFFEYELSSKLEHGRELQAVVSWGEGFVPPEKTYRMTFDSLSHRGIEYADFNVEIDGDISEWKGRNYIYLGSREDVFPEGGRRRRWQGADDLSAKLYLGWDSAYFYIAAEVIDDAHFNSREGGSIWDGDSFQFAVASPGISEPFNLGLALTQKGVQFHQWLGQEDAAERAEYAVVRDEEKKKTYYELSIPLELLLPRAGAGFMFGLNAVFFDDDDGEGYDYWLQIAPGIAGGWDPSAFDRFLLLD